MATFNMAWMFVVFAMLIVAMNSSDILELVGYTSTGSPLPALALTIVALMLAVTGGLGAVGVLG